MIRELSSTTLERLPSVMKKKWQDVRTYLATSRRHCSALMSLKYRSRIRPHHASCTVLPYLLTLNATPSRDCGAAVITETKKKRLKTPTSLTNVMTSPFTRTKTWRPVRAPVTGYCSIFQILWTRSDWMWSQTKASRTGTPLPSTMTVPRYCSPTNGVVVVAHAAEPMIHWIGALMHCTTSSITSWNFAAISRYPLHRWKKKTVWHTTVPSCLYRAAISLFSPGTRVAFLS